MFGNASAKKCQGRSKAVETKGDSVAVKQTSREQVPVSISPLLEQQNSGNARTTRSCLCLAGACNILYEVHKKICMKRMERVDMAVIRVWRYYVL